MPVIGDQVGLTLDRIILATDFSPVAEKASGYARALAQRFSSSLSVAHVIDLSVATLSADAVVGLPLDEMRRAGTADQERLVSDMASAGVRTTAHTLESHSAAATIVGFAKELRADLIVTGTNSRRGLSKAIFGSCSESIIRHAVCPVLTVGPKAKPAPKGGLSFQTIVFATDFSTDAAKQAAIALNFAQDSVGKLYLCHVVNRPGKDIAETVGKSLKFEAALEKLIPESSYEWCSPDCVVDMGAVAPHILALARKVRADLIVLGAKHSASWYTHLVEGTVEEVLLEAECPVMTICAQ